MRNLCIISNNKLTSGLEIFLAVGNMGDTIMYLLPSNEALVYSLRSKMNLKLYFYKQKMRIYAKKVNRTLVIPKDYCIFANKKCVFTQKK